MALGVHLKSFSVAADAAKEWMNEWSELLQRRKLERRRASRVKEGLSSFKWGLILPNFSCETILRKKWRWQNQSGGFEPCSTDLRNNFLVESGRKLTIQELMCSKIKKVWYIFQNGSLVWSFRGWPRLWQRLMVSFAKRQKIFKCFLWKFTVYWLCRPWIRLKIVTKRTKMARIQSRSGLKLQNILT